MTYTKNQQLNKTKKREISLPRLHKKAWSVFSKWIRARDKKCVCCGSTKDLQAGHIIHIDALDFNEKAINAECRQCNYYKSGNLFVYSLYLESKYGKGILQELENEAHKVKKYTRDELENIIKKYS